MFLALLYSLIIHQSVTFASPFHKYPYVFLLDIGNEELQTKSEQIRVSVPGGSLALRIPAIGESDSIAHVRVSGIDFDNDLKANIVDGGPGYKYVVIVFMGNPGRAYDAVVTVSTMDNDKDVDSDTDSAGIDEVKSTYEVAEDCEEEANDSAETEEHKSAESDEQLTSASNFYDSAENVDINGKEDENEVEVNVSSDEVVKSEEDSSDSDRTDIQDYSDSDSRKENNDYADSNDQKENNDYADADDHKENNDYADADDQKENNDYADTDDLKENNDYADTDDQKENNNYADADDQKENNDYVDANAPRAEKYSANEEYDTEDNNQATRELDSNLYDKYNSLRPHLYNYAKVPQEVNSVENEVDYNVDDNDGIVYSPEDPVELDQMFNDEEVHNDAEKFRDSNNNNYADAEENSAVAY